MLFHSFAEGSLAAILRVGFEFGNIGRRGRRRTAEEVLQNPLTALYNGGSVRI
jgi:hypothetical protein